MVFSYCPSCGSLLSAKEIGDEGLVPYCDKCVRPWFPFSYPCVICLVTDSGGNILLIRQSYGSGRFVCVAGYIREKETAEQCAAREILEETGLHAEKLRYINSYYFGKHDNLMSGFACLVRRDELKLSGEVAEAEWFTPAEAKEHLRDASVARMLLEEYLASGTAFN